MPAANVKSRWTAGKLEFYDAISGTTLFSLDGPNLKALIPAGSTLDASAATILLAANAIATAAIAAGAVTKAKTAMFVSVELTGTGAPQNIAHGLGAVPAFVFGSPTDTSPATAGIYTLTEGAHDATNVIVTVTSGKKFKVLAMA
jgi:hypothetical protein